mgnify:CR=1 FL=1
MINRFASFLILPIAASALASSSATDASCDALPYYAKIIEIITSANWYDNVIALGIEGGDFALAYPATEQLHIWATPLSGLSFLAPAADLTFASSDTGMATVSVGGLVTSKDTGGVTTITVDITAKGDIDASAVCTVS